MHAAVAVVAVESALVPVALRQLLQPAQILAQALRRDGRVLPALVRVRLAGDERRGAEPRLPHLPDVLLLLGVVVELHLLGRARTVLQGLHAVARAGVGLFLRLAAELDEQPAAALG